jgi:hypothetical protein
MFLGAFTPSLSCGKERMNEWWNHIPLRTPVHLLPRGVSSYYLLSHPACDPRTPGFKSLVLEVRPWFAVRRRRKARKKRKKKNGPNRHGLHASALPTPRPCLTRCYPRVRPVRSSPHSPAFDWSCRMAIVKFHGRFVRRGWLLTCRVPRYGNITRQVCKFTPTMPPLPYSRPSLA